MELLLIIAVVAAFVLLVKHTKAKGRISELTLNLKARQNEIADLEREVVRLRGDLQVQLQALQRFKPIQNVEVEAKRLRFEAEAQRDDLVQGARNRLEKAEEKLQSAVAEADRIVASTGNRRRCVCRNGQGQGADRSRSGDEEPHRGIRRRLHRADLQPAR